MDTTVGFQARNNCPASIKGAFPFRVGTSSYIMPAGVLENIRHLAGLVDDIEIVLFESAEISLQPAAEEMRQIAEIGATSNLTFTIHMPLDARLGSADRAEREKSVLKCLKTIDLAQPLSPFAYVMHLDISQDADGRPAIPSGGELTRWRRAIDDSISAVLRHGVRPELICVETLFYPIKLAEEVILDHGLSVCLDVGHILLSGESSRITLTGIWNARG